MSNIMESIKLFCDGDKIICYNVYSMSIYNLHGIVGDIITLMNEHSPQVVRDIVRTKYDKDAQSTVFKLMDNINETKKFSCPDDFMVEPNHEFSGFPIAELSFPPVHSCNLRCKYCFACSGHNFKDNEKLISKSVIRKAVEFFMLDFAKSALKYRINFVSGGEPFLNIESIEETYKIVEGISTSLGKKCNIWICTNGTIYDDKIKDFLKKYNQSIGISLDGPKESHDCMRVFPDGSGSYDTILANMNSVLTDMSISKNTKRLWGLVVINKSNYDLVSIIKHHKELGINDIQMKVVRASENAPWGFNYSDLQLLKEQYYKLAEFLFKKYEEGDLSYFWMILNNNDFYGKLVCRLIYKAQTFYRCSAARYKISVAANGDIYPCDSFVGNSQYRMGNVHEGIDENIRKEFFAMRVSDRNECSICWARFLCAGECYHNSFVRTGTHKINDSFSCELQKILCELAIRTVNRMNKINRQSYKKIENLLRTRKRFEIS